MEAATNAAAIAVPRRLRMLVGVFAAGGLFCLVVAITYALPEGVKPDKRFNISTDRKGVSLRGPSAIPDK